MGAKSIGFAGGAAAVGTGGLSGLLNSCGSKEMLAKRFLTSDCLMSIHPKWPSSTLTALVKLKNIITIRITNFIHNMMDLSPFQLL